MKFSEKLLDYLKKVILYSKVTNKGMAYKALEKAFPMCNILVSEDDIVNMYFDNVHSFQFHWEEGNGYYYLNNIIEK